MKPQLHPLKSSYEIQNNNIVVKIQNFQKWNLEKKTKIILIVLLRSFSASWRKLDREFWNVSGK